ncbi:MAG: hypothetical protein KDB22_13790 [Planctomycetales bacterium]|nr:hypothetical protein [Planctomycetales bacterium]
MRSKSFFRIIAWGVGISVASLETRWFLVGRCSADFWLLSMLTNDATLASLQELNSDTYYALFRFGGTKLTSNTSFRATPG